MITEVVILSLLTSLTLGIPISTQSHAGDARTLLLNDKKVGKIYVSFGKSTILSFPGKPSKVVLGNRGAFTLEYIESDIAIAALHQSAQSNLFVYVGGRRFAFDLISRAINSDEIVIIRDSDSVPVKVVR